MGGAVLAGALIGGGTALITGGDPLEGAFMGGISGGIGAGISGGFAGPLGAEAAFGAGLAEELGIAGAGMGAAEGFASLGITSMEEAAAAGFADSWASAGLGETIDFNSVGSNFFGGPTGADGFNSFTGTQPGVSQTFANPQLSAEVLNLLGYPQGIPGPDTLGGITNFTSPLDNFGFPAGVDAATGGTGNFDFYKAIGKYGPDLAKAGINYVLQNQQAAKYANAADIASAKGDALSQPQRQPYQLQLSQLLTNPQQFYATNPVVQAQLDVARQQFMANTGKMGTGGTQFNDYLKNVQNVSAGTFNDQAQLLSTLSGFPQGPGYAGMAYGNLMDKSISQSGEAFRGFGDKDLIGKIIDDLKKSGTGDQSPSGTTTVYSA